MDGRDFTVGAVLRGTFRLIGRRRCGFAVAAGLLVSLPVLLSPLVNAAALRAVLGGHLWQFGSPGDVLFRISLLYTLATLLLSLVLFGTVVSAALGDARGEAPSLGRDLRASLRLFLPNLAIGVLFYLAFTLGLVLLVVPGLMLQCAWYVAIPAHMAEQPGLFRAFGRSRALTKGHRWRVFGVLLIYGLALGGAGGLDYVLTLSLARSGLDGGVLWVWRAVYAALSASLNVVCSAAPTVAHIELDRVKGGSLSSDLAEAFA